MPSSSTKSSLGEVFRLFLRLGATAFGGPAAHIALMQQEAVERRRWVSRERFLDLVGACNLLPGPSSTQVAMALGFSRAGWAGLLVAGTCFIVPASLATVALAWVYVRYGNLPVAQGLLYGAKPVMVAIVALAIWKLGRTAFRNWLLAFGGAFSLVACLLGMPPFAVLVLCGAAVMTVHWAQRRSGSKKGATAAALLPVVAGALPPITGLGAVFFVFLKLGVVVFGSGYVLLAFLKADLVDRLHWISDTQLLDAVTAGQLTPGPVFATATFVGYLLRGWSGAAVATLAIFLPSFLMAGAVAAIAGHVRKSALAGAFLDGISSAAVALMAVVGLALGRAVLVDGWTWALGLGAAIALLRFRVNPTWPLLGGAGLGLLLHRIG